MLYFVSQEFKVGILFSFFIVIFYWDFILKLDLYRVMSKEQFITVNLKIRISKKNLVCFPLIEGSIQGMFQAKKSVDGSRTGVLRWMKQEGLCHDHSCENIYMKPEPPNQLLNSAKGSEEYQES